MSLETCVLQHPNILHVFVRGVHGALAARGIFEAEQEGRQAMNSQLSRNPFRHSLPQKGRDGRAKEMLLATATLWQV